jgi:flagellar motor switch protein FliM
VLSQREIDELLKGIYSGEVDVEEIKNDKKETKIKKYDFKGPNKFAKEQIRTLNIIHENFAQLMASHLTGMLRIYCQVDVVSIEEQTYQEFNNSLPEPVILAILRLNPLEGPALIEVSPSIAYGIIDLILGGKGREVGPSMNFTEIEVALIERVVKQLLVFLKESWYRVLEINPSIDKIETNAQFAQIVSPNETIAIITLAVQIGEIEGLVNFCIPYLSIEPVIKNLNTKYWFSSNYTKKETETRKADIAKRIMKTPLIIKAILGESTLTISDILNLQKGDVLNLEKKIKQNLEVKVGHLNKFKGVLGVSNRKYAIKITDIIREEEDNDE